jgi:hypothetical protein
MAWAYNTPEGTPNNGPTIASIALAVTTLALVALLLRIYVRTRITKAIGLGTYLKGVSADDRHLFASVPRSLWRDLDKAMAN